MQVILDLILFVLQIYTYVLIAAAIMSWLISFDVINFRNQLVRSIWTTLNALTEPLLRPIRNLLPNLGGVDVSPIVLFLIIMAVEGIIVKYIYPYVF